MVHKVARIYEWRAITQLPAVYVAVKREASIERVPTK